jgi:hypothetical protein
MATKKKLAKSKKCLPSPERYPRCKAFGLQVRYRDKGWAYITHEDIAKMFTEKGDSFSTKFNTMFGVQTCAVEGLYPHDVEAVLERMVSGRITGTQAFWD